MIRLEQRCCAITLRDGNTLDVNGHYRGTLVSYDMSSARRWSLREYILIIYSVDPCPLTAGRLCKSFT